MATLPGENATSISSPPESKERETEISSFPVEMSELNTSLGAAIMQPNNEKMEDTEEVDTTAGAEQTQQPPPTSDPPQETTTTTTTSAPLTTDDNENPTTTAKPTPHRKPSEAGLGPATDLPIVAPSTTHSTGPTLSITLMLITGARHPYKIDEKYLKNRKVETSGASRSGKAGGGTDEVAGGPGGEFDPREISGYKLKELIWTDWRSEWEPRPASPSSIRLIILGRLVEDQRSLKEFPFKLEETNVVHMTVKPADFLDDDDTGGGKKGQSIRGNDGEERGAGCCRCVIL